jgi:hypothetical protein
MKYYRYLDLDHKVACEKLKNYAMENASKIKNFWTFLNTPKLLKLFPEVQSMFDPLNITIKQISLITSNNTSIRDGIHRDHTNCNVRINIPIMNCEGSVTNFYSSNAEPQKLLLSNGIPYYQIDYNKCVLVDSFCLEKPAALRIREPHQVIASSQQSPRVSCTIEFVENIDYLLD